MASRLKLHEKLKELTDNVYFQPPASIYLNYPAIVYKVSDIDNMHANNQVYLQKLGYEITVIDEDPDSEIAEKISLMPKCRPGRPYTVDGLNHFIFTLYY